MAQSWHVIDVILIPKIPKANKFKDLPDRESRSPPSSAYACCNAKALQALKFRAHWQATELIHALRVWVHRSVEWRLPAVCAKLDITRAFDSIPLAVVFGTLYAPVRPGRVECKTGNGGRYPVSLFPWQKGSDKDAQDLHGFLARPWIEFSPLWPLTSLLWEWTFMELGCCLPLLRMMCTCVALPEPISRLSSKQFLPPCPPWV
eukprot:1123034-Amphidinium_carterae.1